MKLTDKIGKFFLVRVNNVLLTNGIETYADLMDLYHKEGFSGIFALKGMPHSQNAMLDIENVVKAFLEAEQKGVQEDDSPTLSFQDYINTLKQFADNADACAITNELYTDDGYKITFKVEKVKQ